MATRQLRDAMFKLHEEVLDTRQFIDAAQQRLATMPEDEPLKARLGRSLRDLNYYVVDRIEDAQMSQQLLKATAKSILNEYAEKKAAIRRQAIAAKEESEEKIAAATAQAEPADEDPDDDPESLFVGKDPKLSAKTADDDSDYSLASLFIGKDAKLSAETADDDFDYSIASIFEEKDLKQPAEATKDDSGDSLASLFEEKRPEPKTSPFTPKHGTYGTKTGPIRGQKRPRSNTMNAFERGPKRQQTMQKREIPLLSSGLLSKYRILLHVAPDEKTENLRKHGFSGLQHDVKHLCKVIVLKYASKYLHFEKKVLNRKGFRCITCHCENELKEERGEEKTPEKYAKGDQDVEKPLYACYHCALRSVPCIMERKGTLYLLPLPPQLRRGRSDGSRYWLREHRNSMNLVEWET